MKTGIITVLIMCASAALGAFAQGTMNSGGFVSLSLEKPANSDADPKTTISLAPQAGYFVIDNLSLDLLVNFNTAFWTEIHTAPGYSMEFEFSATSLGFGLGARYFFRNYYGGLGFLYESTRTSSGSWDGQIDDFKSAMYLEPKAGYLLPLAKNVYADLGLSYKLGVGEVYTSNEIGGENFTEDGSANEYGKLQFLAGLQIFFPIKSDKN